MNYKIKGEKSIMNLYNNIKKIRNPKIGLYHEHEKDKDYMELNFYMDMEDGTTFKCEIPMIDLNNILIFNETNRVSGEYGKPKTFNNDTYIKLKIEPVNNTYFTFNDITSYKEMSMEDIEKELGYKIKLKKDED